MELITLKNISKSYGDRKKVKALQGFNFFLSKGEMVAIMGKSGSGKSTVLNVLSGIDILDDGEYFFQGKDMKLVTNDEMTLFRREHIGFVLQHFALIPDYTIYDNIAFSLLLQHESKQKIRERVFAIAKELEIEEILFKYPDEVSGGEAQRTAIARAIIHNPQLILADEPTGALDEETGFRIMNILKKLHEKGHTIVIVTHDSNVAAMCERTVWIKDGKNI
ncbi:MAG: ABC transporter ATP-binding protein [Lachnospiraceae bacterium]|nr:ABC transporter ATP-binding protein [Lachnospiraceae bacterium]